MGWSRSIPSPTSSCSPRFPSDSPGRPCCARFEPPRHRRRRFVSDGTLRLVYAGAVTPVYELEVAIAAVAELRRQRPSLPVTLDILGRGDAEESLRDCASRLELDDAVRL